VTCATVYEAVGFLPLVDGFNLFPTPVRPPALLSTCIVCGSRPPSRSCVGRFCWLGLFLRHCVSSSRPGVQLDPPLPPGGGVSIVDIAVAAPAMTSDGVAGLFARHFTRVRSGGARGGRLSPSPPASPTGHGASAASSLLPRFLNLSTTSADTAASRGGASPTASTEALDGPTAAAAVKPGAATYKEDHRDDSDELAPPKHLRLDAWCKLGETYDRRHAGIAAMHVLIRQHERGGVGGGQAAAVGSAPAAAAALGAAATAPCSYSRRDNKFLMAFLRCKKFDTARAFDEYTNYSRFHDEYGWLPTTQRDLVRRLLTSGAFSILPTRDPDGRVLLSVVTRHLLALVDEVGASQVTSILKAILFLLEVLIADVEAQIFGAVIVQNLEGYALRYVRYMKASEYRLFLHLCQDCYPLRANAMYAVHEPLVLRTVWAIVRPFMKAKVKRRFKTFGASYSVLYDHIPRESLTADFGGTLQFDANAAASRWIAAVDAANGLTQSP